jgi:rubredoxin
MPRVVAIEDAETRKLIRVNNVKIPFMGPFSAAPGEAVAFMIQDQPQRTTRAHYHAVDQFQVIVGGKGKFGRHDVSPYSVHFSRAHTPYGPLLPAQETGGWSFLTLRARTDTGANFFPEAKEKLKRTPNHQPFQLTRHVEFPDSANGEASIVDVPGMKDERGLFACTLRMAPNAKYTAPDPSRGDGQYLVVVKGSLWYHDKEHKACTIVFVEPQEGAFELHAGAEGLEAIIMNFPETTAHGAGVGASTAAMGYKQWQCALCAFAYDEALGMPEEGIPPGTRWQDVPETWTCPDCSAAKSDFEMVEVTAAS